MSGIFIPLGVLMKHLAMLLQKKSTSANDFSDIALYFLGDIS